MTLLPGLNITSFPRVSHSCIKCIFKKFVKRSTILEIELKQYARTIMLEIINALGALQDN